MSNEQERDDEDFCYTCNRTTQWEGEQCKSCGRSWGHELPEDGAAQ